MKKRLLYYIMYYMMKHIFTVFALTFLIALLSVHALAQEGSIKRLVGATEKEKSVCTIIRDKIDRGEDIKNHVKTGIQMGHDACFIVTCAVGHNGDLGQVVTGAFEAGSSSDVIARCAVDAGADFEMLAAIIAQAAPFSLCYLPPRDEVIPVGTSFPGGRDDRTLSPSSF